MGQPEVIIYTDHAPFQYVLHKKQLTQQAARWTQFLAKFNINIQYSKGTLNPVADALSRYPNQVNTISSMPLARKERTEWIEAYLEDPDTRDLYQLLQQHSKRKIGNYQIKRGLLFTNEGRLRVPNNDTIITRVLIDSHDSTGHFGISKTFDKVKKIYFWPTMQQDVEEYVTSCDGCQRNKAVTGGTSGFLQPLPILDKPWEDIAMDLITNLPEVGPYNAILTVIN